MKNSSWRFSIRSPTLSGPSSLRSTPVSRLSHGSAWRAATRTIGRSWQPPSHCDARFGPKTPTSLGAAWRPGRRTGWRCTCPKSHLDGGHHRAHTTERTQLKAPSPLSNPPPSRRIIIHLSAGGMMHVWLQDLRYALRMLHNNAGVTLVMAASLAIGIGANSAIFSVVDALLLRPLPYPQPDRLAAVWLHSPGIGILRDWPSPGQYIDIQNENHSFELTALAKSRSVTLTGREQPERIDGMQTQSSLLGMLGAKPLLGRLLLPEEDQPGKPADRKSTRLNSSHLGISYA